MARAFGLTRGVPYERAWLQQQYGLAGMPRESIERAQRLGVPGFEGDLDTLAKELGPEAALRRVQEQYRLEFGVGGGGPTDIGKMSSIVVGLNQTADAMLRIVEGMGSDVPAEREGALRQLLRQPGKDPNDVVSAIERLQVNQERVSLAVANEFMPLLIDLQQAAVGLMREVLPSLARNVFVPMLKFVGGVTGLDQPAMNENRGLGEYDLTPPSLPRSGTAHQQYLKSRGAAYGALPRETQLKLDRLARTARSPEEYVRLSAALVPALGAVPAGFEDFMATDKSGQLYTEWLLKSMQHAETSPSLSDLQQSMAHWGNYGAKSESLSKLSVDRLAASMDTLTGAVKENTDERGKKTGNALTNEAQ
jgi:hypothetical protein